MYLLNSTVVIVNILDTPIYLGCFYFKENGAEKAVEMESDIQRQILENYGKNAFKEDLEIENLQKNVNFLFVLCTSLHLVYFQGSKRVDNPLYYTVMIKQINNINFNFKSRIDF